MPQVVLLPECQTVFTDPQFPGHLRLGLATMNHQLHCLALKLLIVSLLYLLFFHGLFHFTLSFRVRQIRGGSEGGESLAAVAVTSSSTRFAPVFVPIPKTIVIAAMLRRWPRVPPWPARGS